MHNHPDPPINEQIRRALAVRAEETTMSPNALDDIRQRRSAPWWGRPTAYAAVAALVALIAGVAFFVNPDDDTTPVDAAGSPTLAPDNQPEPTVTTGPPVSAPSELVIWPLDDRTFTDGQAAAADWASEVLGVTNPQFAISETNEPFEGEPGTEVHSLLGPTEDAVSSHVVSRVVTASPDGGATWVVTQALSDELTIDLVERNSSDTIRVTGVGRTFEGTAHLTVNDNEPVLAQIGGGDFDEFSVVVAADPAQTAIIRIEGSLGLEDGVPDVTSFATVPVARSTDIVVFGVAADDVLNVRKTAGADSEIVAELAPDASGIVHTGVETAVGTDQWWEIITPSGERGFVNRRYLSVQRDVSIAGLADRLVELTESSLASLDVSALASSVEIGGIGVFADWPTPFTAVERDALDQPRNWHPEGAHDGTCDCDLTVAEFLRLDTAPWSLAQYQLGHGVEEPNPGFGWSTGLTEDFYDRFATVTAYILPPDVDENLDWRRYTVVWDFDDGAPRIRGIWFWGWTP